MHSRILFIKVIVMPSVKAQWITGLDSNFFGKIVRLSAQSRSEGLYTCLNHLILHCLWPARVCRREHHNRRRLELLFNTKRQTRGRSTEQKQQLIDSILNLCNSFNLVDLWRKRHPNESLFTWHQNTSAIQCSHK